MAIVRFLLVFLITIGCWYLPERQVPAIQIEPTPQLPQVILRENLIQQATNCIAQEMAARGGNKRYTVEAVRAPAGLRLPWGHITYSCSLPNGIRKSLLTAVNLEVLVDGAP